ncbi:hypothetical protein M409DRAFT_19231 [Zasmidium cellare ATCC 36951]|uniref:Major facilitator superfamily (MFS) profile domain-containing protein n=1 Tax=Zasmidium cellare ATCC 36951 TaxID=1080233 RepID=A0A6A6CX83_ZASCE|nr:uncharacterized protein M409DRAFT_19231 [Zasmidium cellare ATCC 36951]KAF2170409.1 hypothetical protein M409DRAFT_19231 [Zasmidium cellare ATCC 36951]
MEKNTVAPTESPPVSPSSSVDTDGEDLTLFEKKCLLINRETDGNGMGKYQWYVWFLCGFGYLLDLLWAQAFGLILQSLEQELGFSGNESGNISVAFSAGLTAGAFTWGVLVDIIGRKWAFNLTCFITAVFGLGLGGCNTYNAFLVVTAFTGFGIGGNIPIDTTICLECIPQDRRFMLALLSIFQPIGVVITSVLAYAYIPNYSCSPNFSQPDPLPSCKNVADGQPCCTKDSNMGWRYLLFTLGAITLGVFLLRSVIFRFKESPKFLVARGKDQKAVEVLQAIARMNKRSCSVTLSEFEELNHQHKISRVITEADEGKKKTWNDIFAEEGLRYRELFKDQQMIRLTILVWITYACDFWGFTLAGTYLPSILAIKNSEINLSLQHTYRSYIAIYAPGIVGVVVGSMMYGVPTIGRKLAMVISSGLMGASIFIFSTVNSEASNIGLNAMEYFFQSMFNAVLYGWTPEAFPAPIRGTACGIAAFWGRLFSILAPLIAQSRIPTSGLADNPESINTVL